MPLADKQITPKCELFQASGQQAGAGVGAELRLEFTVPRSHPGRSYVYAEYKSYKIPPFRLTTNSSVPVHTTARPQGQGRGAEQDLLHTSWSALQGKQPLTMPPPLIICSKIPQTPSLVPAWHLRSIQAHPGILAGRYSLRAPGYG